MTVTVWLKEEIVLNWARYEKNLGEIFNMAIWDPTVGDIVDHDWVQVNIPVEQYKQIKSHIL